MEVTGEVGETIVTGFPPVWTHSTFSFIKSGEVPYRVTELRISQKVVPAGLEIPDPVTVPLGAGTVTTTRSLPLTQAPLTVHLNVYVPSIRFVTPVELDEGFVMVGIFGPLTIVHKPD